MPDAPEPGSFVHVYRPTLGRRMGSLAVLGLCVACVGLPLVLMLYPAIKLLVDEPQARPIVAGGLCFLAPLGVIFLLLIVQLAVGVLAQFFGHTLKVTPGGLEHRSWPYRQIRCSWTEVERIAKYFLFYDAIYLKSYEFSGPSLASKKWWKIFNPAEQNFILLSGMSGWPDGALAEDLREYAPQMFDPATGKPAAIPAQQPSTGISRDERLYAALSHAGALLFPVFIPLAFWLAERKKSAYVAFQSLQALIFQILTQGVFVATLLCAACGLLIPVGLTQLSDRIAIDGRTYGLIVLAAFSLAGLLSAMALAMLLYSGVAIAQTYRGEDFRYPLIGKWLEDGINNPICRYISFVGQKKDNHADGSGGVVKVVHCQKGGFQG